MFLFTVFQHVQTAFFEMFSLIVCSEPGPLLCVFVLTMLPWVKWIKRNILQQLHCWASNMKPYALQTNQNIKI